jgi:hypothetical protein
MNRLHDDQDPACPHCRVAAAFNAWMVSPGAQCFADAMGDREPEGTSEDHVKAAGFARGMAVVFAYLIQEVSTDSPAFAAHMVTEFGRVLDQAMAAHRAQQQARH